LRFFNELKVEMQKRYEGIELSLIGEDLHPSFPVIPHDSFTSLSEAQDAQDVVQALNEYFQIWQEEISKSCGVIEKFIGDAVVAVFFKKTSPQYLNDSLQTSLNVQLRLKDWNKSRKAKGLFELKNGIGLSHGLVHLHVIANEIKKHLVASSTALTRAEELEALSKRQCTRKSSWMIHSLSFWTNRLTFMRLMQEQKQFSSGNKRFRFEYLKSSGFLQ